VIGGHSAAYERAYAAARKIPLQALKPDTPLSIEAKELSQGTWLEFLRRQELNLTPRVTLKQETADLAISKLPKGTHLVVSGSGVWWCQTARLDAKNRRRSSFWLVVF
jgi:hypothetical protein